MSTTSPRRGASRGFLWLGLLLLLGVAGYLGWFWWAHGRTPPVDMAKVLEKNALGVGHMDRYEFQSAAEAFEQVRKMAPDWTPGKINMAIALLNLGGDPNGKEEERARLEKRILDLLNDVLKVEPDNSYANFNVGYLYLLWKSQMAEAEPYFEKVTKADPNDAATWQWLGHCRQEKPEEAVKCFRRAAELDPYNNAALYELQVTLRTLGRDAEAAKVMKEWDRLRTKDGLDLSDSLTPTSSSKYLERGRYAEVIGWVPPPSPPKAGPVPLFERDERFKAEPAEGWHWAKAADLGAGAVGDVRRRVRERFGAVVVSFDYDGDGRPDLLLLGAVVNKDGTVRDLLLHNEGEGRFRDVTDKAGLATPRTSLGCCVADFNNDGRPDLLITGVGEQHLFRNTGNGFEDDSAAAGLDKIKAVCLGAVMLDLDGDGDLDVVLSQYADTPEKALLALEGKREGTGGGVAVFWNVGEAKPANKGVDPPPLPTAFRRADGPEGLLGPAGAVVGTPFSDVDNDRDLDLIVFADGRAPSLALNDRVGRFHRADLPEQLVPRADWNGALVLDLNHRDRSDLLFVGPERAPALLVSEPRTGGDDPAKWFRRQATDSPPLIQAQAIDIDLDGWTDVVGLSRKGKPVLLHNDGTKLVTQAEAFGAESDWQKDVIGLLAADLDCDGNPDVLLWSEGDGLYLRRSRGNDNKSIKISVSGHRRVALKTGGSPERVNADGIGVRVVVEAEDHWAGAEYATLNAGLGQATGPILFGLGKHSEANLVRMFWPDGCQQAEFNQAPGACRVVRIEETNRKQTSCPLLFAWDGRRFAFVTDFLGAGSVGECEPDGGHRPPRPEESVKIEPEQLAPLDGHYVLKIAEPMSELTYLDRLQLIVLDHPADVRVYPDERFDAGGKPPTQDLLAFRDEIFPVKATDHRGRDVTAKLARWDRDTADDFARRSWIGFAEEHAVTLDFGDRLAKFGPKDRLFLCLAGWTDYPYPESIWAAHQAGVEMLPPVLERRTADGNWKKVADAGFPAGMPRLMTLEVTGLLGGPRCELRLRTNLHVFWDQVYVAPLLETVAAGQGGRVRGSVLEVKDAALSARGCVKEYSPDGREPTLYDYDRLDSFPVSRLSGRLTRFGDVTELLRAADDRFVIFGSGDELGVRFDAAGLPPLPEGWRRSYVLRTWGYCKDASPFTAHGDTVGPLPFRAMSNYPYRANEKHPDPDYDREWNTRRVGR